MSTYEDTLAFVDFIMQFKTWDYDRQTHAIEAIRAEDPHFADIACIMERIRDRAHEGRAAA